MINKRYPKYYRKLHRVFFLLLMNLLLITCPLHAEQPTPDNSRVIIVGGNSNYPPYQFLDKNGQPTGYIVDLTKAIAQEMGMKIEIRLGDFEKLRKGLDAGKIDILEGMSYSERRAQSYDFSPPHSIIVHAIFARKGTPVVKTLEELRGKKVLVHRGGGMYDYMMEHSYANELVLTDSPRENMKQLASGICDYAVVALLPGMYIIREDKLSNIVPVSKNVISPRYYCYAVKKGNVELLAQFNQGMTILKKTGQFDAIYNKWLGVLEPQSISWRVVAKYAAMVVIPLLLVLIGTLLWSYALRKQVAQRTESLSTALTELRRNQEQLIQADKIQLENALINRSLEIAQEIQQSFLPVCPETLPGMLMASACEPAAHVGGDYYDLFILKDGGVDVVIADITGHSVGSALLMTETRSVLQAKVNSSRAPGKMLSELNNLLLNDLAKAEMQISMFYARIDTDSRRVFYSNAGHCRPLFYSSRQGIVSQLDADGLIIGIMSDVVFEELFVQFEAHDMLLLYTDGVIEGENRAGEQFGTERLGAILLRHHSQEPKKLIREILDELTLFTGTETRADDVALFVIKFVPS
jgi:serine phosphatase RsbU (regulator of sigma subunit)/ABC-type amino acid transport substrate-binding protein